jgi:5-amino-6-(5-phosphoribosylamino)uracil reductase
VFSDPENPVLVLGAATADPEMASALGGVCEVRLLDSLDGSSIVGQLDGVILAEGGPTLNGDLIASGCVDEINWTISPFLVSGDSKRMAVGPEGVHQMTLRRSWIGERALFLRYVRV